MSARSVPLALFAAALLGACDGGEPSPDPWERGQVRIATVALPAGISASPAHFERNLARRFVESLGLEPVFVEAPTPAAVVAAMLDGEADIAATGNAWRDSSPELRLGRQYRWVEHLVVRRYKGVSPKAPSDLVGAPIVVAAGDGVVGTLEGLRATHPELSWTESAEQSPAALVGAVWRREIELTVATNDHLTTLRHYYPEIRPSISLATGQPVAWLFPRGASRKLYVGSIYFLNGLERSGELDRLTEEHFGHLREFDYVTTRRMLRRAHERLPRFQKSFKAAAAADGLDWRLLAAIGYQESQWNPKAVSPTGVRGIMMLTRTTAKELGVNRRDPAQSIAGASRYLADLYRRLPESIDDPDRAWFAIAAYNAGFRRLLGARQLTADAGFDPDRWSEVREFLPRLGDPAWYSRGLHGSGRGHEAAKFVARVRRFYAVLKHRYPGRESDS